MEKESVKLQDRNYWWYFGFFIILIFLLQCLFGLYSYNVIKPKIIQSLDVNLEKFKQNILKIIEDSENNDINEYYSLFERKKREVEGSGEEYNEYEDSSEFEDEYELKNVEEFCKRINENCVQSGLPGLPGMPGLKGDKGYRGLSGLPGPQGPPGTAAPTTTTVTLEPISIDISSEPEWTTANTTENSSVAEIPTTKPSKSTSISKIVSLYFLSLIVLVVN